MDTFDIENLLNKPNAIPSYYEVVDFIKKSGNKLSDYLTQNAATFGYEIITQELCKDLAISIAKTFLPIKDRLTIVEVGAGNGKLSYFLQQAFDEVAPGKVKIKATDNGFQRREQNFCTIEKIDAQDIAKLNPDIVLCSWMPRQLSDINIRNHISPQEYSTYEKISIAAGTTMSPEHLAREDMTHYRRMNKKLLGYILLGPVHACGHHLKTYGITNFHDTQFVFDNIGKYVDSQKIVRDANPQYVQEGYIQSRLHDVLNLNIYDFAQDADFKGSSSTTRVFRNGHYISPTEIAKRNHQYESRMIKQQQRFAKL